MGRRLHHGGDVDQKSHHAGEHGAAPADPDQPAVRLHHRRGVAQRGQEVRALPEDGGAQRSEEEGEGPAEGLRQGRVRSGPHRQASGSGPDPAHRQRRRPQPRLFLVGPHAIRPEEHAVHAQHLHV